MGIQQKIEKEIRRKSKKLANTTRRIYEIEHSNTKKRFRDVVSNFFILRPDSLVNLKNQENELKTDLPVLKFINNIQPNPDNPDPSQIEKEKKDLYRNYIYATRGRNQIRTDFYQSQKNYRKKQQDIEKKTKALINLRDSSASTHKNIIKIREKKEDIAYLGLEQYHDSRRMSDAQTNYEFSKKIISNAGTNPKKIRLLKDQTKQLNRAINKQKKLQRKFEENEKKSLKARFLLLHGIPKKNIPDMTVRPPNDNRGQDKDILEYVKYERRTLDFEKDYIFSRKILERYAATGKTDELKNQFKSLRQAIKKRDSYREKLENAENNQRKNNEKLETLDKNEKTLNANEETLKKNEAVLETKIQEITNIDEDKRSPEQNENLAKYLKEHEQLTQQKKDLKQKKEALIQERGNLKQKTNHLTRQANDARKLHDFANQLINNASPKGDASKLPELLAHLDVAATRQKKYRNELNSAEKALLKATTETSEKAGSQKQKDLKIEQSTRQIKDAELAHSMINDLIDQAIAKGNPSDLTDQCKDLKKGIDETRKYRKSLEKRDNQYLKTKMKQGENTDKLDKLKENLVIKLQQPLSSPSLRAEQINNEYLQKDENLSQLTPKEIKEFKKLTLNREKLFFSEKQDDRRTKNAINDYGFAKAFLEKAQADRDPSNLPNQFKRMKVDIAERNRLTKALEKEEKKQFDKKDKILKAEFKVAELKKKRLELDKAVLSDGSNTDSKYIEKKSALDSDIQYQEWKVEKLKRREKQNEKRDEIRLKNSVENEAAAKQILKDMLDPNATDAQIEAAKQRFVDLKDKIKAQKAKEKELSPKEIRTQRKQYRKNLEAAQEKRLKLNKKQAALDIKKPEIVDINNPTPQEKAAQKKYLKQEARLTVKDEQIKREKEHAELIYDFSNQLLQDSITDTTGTKATLLEAQFAGLQTADQLQRESREQIVAIDKKLNRNQSDSEETRLKRQKDDLVYGYNEMQKLIKYAAMTGDATGLKQQCEDLREGIGGRRRYTRQSFGQAINREALEKYTEDLHSKEEKFNQSQSDKEKAENRKIEAEKTQQEKPNKYNEALRNYENKFKNYEDRKLLKEQSERRLKDAYRDYEMGDELIKAAVADTPSTPSKSDRIALLKKQFSVLQTAIQERNKFTERLEKTQKEAKKSERRDAKNIRQAEKKKASLEKNLGKAQAKLEKELKKLGEAQSALQKIDPENTKAIKIQESIIDEQQRIVDKQTARVDKLQQSFDNQSAIVIAMQTKAQENIAAHQELIKNAKQLHTDANTALEETKNKIKTASKNEITKEEATKRFITLASAIPAAAAPTAVTAATVSVSATHVAARTPRPAAATVITPATPVKPKGKTPVIPAAKKEKSAQPVDPTKPAAGTFKIEHSLESKNPDPNLTTILEKSGYATSGYTIERKENGDIVIKRPDGTPNGKPIGSFTLSNTKMAVVSEATNSANDNDALTEIAAIYGAEKNDNNQFEPSVTLGEGVKYFRETKIKKAFEEKAQAKAKALEKETPTQTPMPAVVPPATPKPTVVSPAMPKPTVAPSAAPATQKQKPEKPVRPNTITIPVHTSDIAHAQALYQLNQLTNCTFVNDNNSPGTLFLMEQDSSQSKATKKATISFYDDANGKRQMSVTFNKPIDPKYINAMAFFAAHNQPNDRDGESKKWHHNFTQESSGISPDLVDDSFTKMYQEVALNKNRTLIGVVGSNENLAATQRSTAEQLTPEGQKWKMLHSK